MCAWLEDTFHELRSRGRKKFIFLHFFAKKVLIFFFNFKLQKWPLQLLKSLHSLIYLCKKLACHRHPFPFFSSSIFRFSCFAFISGRQLRGWMSERKIVDTFRSLYLRVSWILCDDVTINWLLDWTRYVFLGVLPWKHFSLHITCSPLIFLFESVELFFPADFRHQTQKLEFSLSIYFSHFLTFIHANELYSATERAKNHSEL